MTTLEHTIEIRRPVEEVFAFVADSCNDPKWCPRVRTCVQQDGDGPGLGARYEAFHTPTLQRAHSRWIEVVDFDPPNRIVTTQTDKVAEFTISYLLQPTDHGSRLTQLDRIDWKISRFFVPVGRRIINRHMKDQLATLKQVLENKQLPETLN
jgi:uncharacterized protein YndB with AHSA1/START domain